jgi:hypothetical protein
MCAALIMQAAAFGEWRAANGPKDCYARLTLVHAHSFKGTMIHIKLSEMFLNK